MAHRWRCLVTLPECVLTVERYRSVVSSFHPVPLPRHCRQLYPTKPNEETPEHQNDPKSAQRHILPIRHSEITAHLTDSHRTMHSPNAFAKPLTRTEVVRNIVQTRPELLAWPISLSSNSCCRDENIRPSHSPPPNKKSPHPPFNPASFPSSSSNPHFSPTRALTLYPSASAPLPHYTPLHTPSTHQHHAIPTTSPDTATPSP